MRTSISAINFWPTCTKSETHSRNAPLSVRRLQLAIKDAKQSKDLPYTLSDSSPYELAILNARAGRNEVAIGLLQKAFDQRDYGLYLLKTAPALDGLRSDPRVVS